MPVSDRVATVKSSMLIALESWPENFVQAWTPRLFLKLDTGVSQTLGSTYGISMVIFLIMPTWKSSIFPRIEFLTHSLALKDQLFTV